MRLLAVMDNCQRWELPAPNHIQISQFSTPLSESQIREELFVRDPPILWYHDSCLKENGLDRLQWGELHSRWSVMVPSCARFSPRWNIYGLQLSVTRSPSLWSLSRRGDLRSSAWRAFKLVLREKYPMELDIITWYAKLGVYSKFWYQAFQATLSWLGNFWFLLSGAVEMQHLLIMRI